MDADWQVCWLPWLLGVPRSSLQGASSRPAHTGVMPWSTRPPFTPPSPPCTRCCTLPHVAGLTQASSCLLHKSQQSSDQDYLSKTIHACVHQCKPSLLPKLHSIVPDSALFSTSWCLGLGSELPESLQHKHRAAQETAVPFIISMHVLVCYCYLTTTTVQCNSAWLHAAQMVVSASTT